MQVKFWGVRGSTPTPQAENLRYGGNTSCVEVRVGNQIYIFDCGTGFRVLGHALEREFGDRAFSAHVFVSHFHWDHIQGMPFFRPLYDSPNSRFYFHSSSRTRSLEQVTEQMSSPYFPVDLDQMRARRDFYDIQNGCLDMEDGVRIKTQWLNHPQGCLGFAWKPGRCARHATDNEPNAEFDKGVRKLAEAPTSDLRRTVSSKTMLPAAGDGDIATGARLSTRHTKRRKELVLYHHDPDHTDAIVDKVVADARNYYPKVRAAAEGMKIRLERGLSASGG
jgi:phosphoribosyl 1,2-cyclic phosphodiesterase